MPLELPKARSKMRTLAASDVIAHWKMEDTAGTTIVDAAGSSNLTNSSSLDIVDGPFTGAANNKGRFFNATSSATGASTAGQRTALLGECTVEVWADLTSIAGNSTFVAHGSNAADATAANNTLLQFQAKAAALQLVWEQGAGVNVVSNSNGDALTGLHHYAARRRATGGTYAVDFFVDGLLVSTTTGLTAPSGGTAGSWALGTHVDTTLSGGVVAGTVYEVRIADLALSDEAIRESASRGLRTWDLARTIASGHFTVHTRALIRDSAGAWLDLTSLYGANFVDGYEDGDAVDDDGATGRLRLRRRSEFSSIAPFMSASRANLVAQLLDITRRIKIEEAVVPHGADESVVAGVHWSLVFDGYARVIGDGSGEVIDLELKDRIYPLQVAWISPNRLGAAPDEDYAYAAGTPIETVLAQQLVDWRPTSIGGTIEGFAGGLDAVTLYCPTSPAFNMNAFALPASSHVAQGQADTVDRTIAWLLRFVWDEVRQEFRYTLADPGRSKTWGASDPILEPWQVLDFKKLEVNDDDIRNEIEVEYGDSSTTDNLTVNKRASVRVENATSVTRWWRRYARIGLATASELNSAAQATTLANNVLSDLANPLADFEVETLPRRDIRLGDLVKMRADGKRLGYDVIVAVVGIRHTRNKGERSTIFSMRAAAPVGRRRRWQDMFDSVGVVGGDGLNPPATPSAPTLESISGGVRVSWGFPANYGNKRYRETEIHVSTSSGFTPSSATLRDVVRGKSAVSIELDPTVLQYVKIVHRDEMGNVSAASAQSSATPRFLPKAPHAQASLSANQAIGASSPDDIVWDTKQAGTDPFGQLNIANGIWTQKKAGPMTIQARALYDAALKAGAQGRLDLLVDIGGGYVTRRSGPVVTATGTPTRAQLELPATLIWLPDGALVKVQIAQPTLGNAGSVVVAGADVTDLQICAGIHT